MSVPAGRWSGRPWKPCSRMPTKETRSRSCALTVSAAGELVFHVFGAIAHFERRLIAERTKDGIAAARAKGKHPGRRPLDADKIADALSLVKAGLSPTAAAKQLG